MRNGPSWMIVATGGVLHGLASEWLISFHQGEQECFHLGNISSIF